MRESPVLGVSNTASDLRAALGEFYHRDSLPEAVVIPGTIQQATELLGLKNVGVLYGNDDDFTISGYDVFMQALADNSVNVLGEETFAKGDTGLQRPIDQPDRQEPGCAGGFGAGGRSCSDHQSGARSRATLARSSAATASTPRRCSSRRAITPKG